MNQTVHRKIAVYGKGGIGKSTVSSNLTAALSDMGIKVLQIGCDPKHDSTRSLIGGEAQTTVLDYLKNTPPDERKLGDIVATGYGGCLCVEAGGPEPGVGCAGRGIISAFDLLSDLGAGTIDSEITLYDVLGDVVCGGFAVPLRNGYADTVYIVTSGEFMAIYAANNILRGTANYDPDRIGGIIFNSRGDPEEDERVDKFSEAVGIPIVCRIGRSSLFMDAEKKGKTVVECFPESDIAEEFRSLAHSILEGKRYRAKYIPENELEKLILGRTTVKPVEAHTKINPVHKERMLPYSSGNFSYNEPIHGCAFSGASSVCTSIEGLTVVLHSPRSCAQFTVQLDANCVKGSVVRGYSTAKNFEDPDVICTDMKEDTMVFGGNGLLRSKLEEQISLGKRDFAVITACPPGITGDDPRTIADELERSNPGVRITVLEEDGNATGDFMQGTIDAGIGLARKYGKRKKTIPLSLNLVGVKTMSSSTRSELDMIEKVLSELGISVNCVFPGYSTVGQLEEVPNAAANLKLNGDSFTGKICSFLNDEYGIPALERPVRGGIEGLSDWVRCVSDFFGIEERAEKVIQEASDHYTKLMEGPKKLLSGKTCCVMTIGEDVAWIREAAERCGIKIERAYVVHRADYNNNLTTERIDPAFSVIEEKDIDSKMEEIDRLRPDILLVPAAADVDPSIYQSRLPCAPSTDPYAGRMLAEDWIRGTLAPKIEGWRKDVARI